MHKRFVDKPMRVSESNIIKYDNGLWIAQYKYDGWNAVVDNSSGTMKCLSRVWLPLGANLSGLVLPENTQLNAEWMGHRPGKAAERLVFFDVLWLKGEWQGNRPYVERLALLRDLKLPEGMEVAPTFENNFSDLYNKAKDGVDYDGIVIKKKDFRLVGNVKNSTENPLMVKVKHREGCHMGR